MDKIETEHKKVVNERDELEKENSVLITENMTL